MALLSPHTGYQIRRSNKEPEWSSICDNVFDQYLDTDDLFAFDTNQPGRSSSNDSVNLFNFSASSGQSHRTDATSPIPSWEATAPEHLIEARQPTAKEPVTFWKKTLHALEQNAAECERKQQTLRTTKSHLDFLSLGGCPSPPIEPPSPTDQSFSAQRRVSRTAASGKGRNITARSVSRGRPSGVTKTAVAGSANPNATVRKCSASPPKMMNPSRYRAGFKDAWTEKLQSDPDKYELRVPPLKGLPLSPPSSARFNHEDDFAAFGSPSHYPPVPTFDDQMSPLTMNFQQAHIHTPVLSPAFNDLAHANNSYISSIPPLQQSLYTPQTVPLNDTAPLYPERTSSLAASKIQAFDFGFSEAATSESWNTGPITESIGNFGNNFGFHDPFAALGDAVLPSIETADLELAGLGISCDPSLVSNLHANPTATSNTTHSSSRSRPYSLQSDPRSKAPSHPHRRAISCQRSLSPSPTPATEPRSSKRASSSRRTSRHRRAKSTNATPRQPQSDKQGGFVNFTAHDSTKILSGVAPSGSSKTKLRREKEAAEKRRRFSQAAVKAVEEAGGDVEALGRVGLSTSAQRSRILPFKMSSTTKRAKHTFAPVGKPNGSSAMRLKGIVFDMDGTLCHPQNYMFSEMRSAVSIPASSDILDYIHALPQQEQDDAFAKIQAIERKAMEEQVPQAGLVTLLEFLDKHEIMKGICTRNFDAPVTHLLKTHVPGHINPFAPVVTRDFRPPKPSPAGILHIAHSWGLVQSATVPETRPEERLLPLVMVGDSVDDIEAGYEAGAFTVLVRSRGKEELEGDGRVGVVVERLDEIVGLLEEGLGSRL
ncbi:uncharacterized protein LTR77_009608 [Saxophila tyrrhenica]|uniref:Uncharacterized protein n=1 Tax=Saxophila tyrrhenica TaxID=1690608 RepID=A0AAV9NYG4_9PEZI|nr:hypothetical protein LTR77_009608 [Saxophila tyrrhenica]